MFDEQEQHRRELDAEMAALERQLRGLTLAPLRVDRDRLMFEAGQAASGRPGSLSYKGGLSWDRHRFWPAAAVAATAATVLLATMLVWQNRSQLVAPQPGQPQVAADAAHSAQEAPVVPGYRLASRDAWPNSGPPFRGYLGVRYVALTAGVAALPVEDPDASDSDSSSDRPQTEPVTARGLLDEMLPAGRRTIPSRS